MTIRGRDSGRFSLPPLRDRIPSGWIDVAALIQPGDPDATRAVDRALDLLGEGRGTLYFRPGTYVVNAPRIPIERSFTCIRGACGARIEQHKSRFGQPLFVVGRDAEGVHFEGITLVGAGSASAGNAAQAAIRCRGADLTVADCEIEGMTTGIYLDGGPNQLGLVDIRDTYIHGVVNGINAVGGDPFAMPFQRHIGFEVFGCRIECSFGLPYQSIGIRTQGLGDIRVVGCNLVGGGLAAEFVDVPEPLDTAVLFAENTCSAGVSGARMVVQNRFSPLALPAALASRRPFVDDAGYVSLIRTPDHGLCLIQANTVDRYTAALTGGAPVRGIYVRPGAGAELVSNQLFSLAGDNKGEDMSRGAGIWIDGVTADVTPHAVSAVANQFDDLQVGVRVEPSEATFLRPALLVADSRFTNIREEAVRAANVDDVIVSNCVADGVWKRRATSLETLLTRGSLFFVRCTRVRVSSLIATNRGLASNQGTSFGVVGSACGTVLITGCTVVDPRVPDGARYRDYREGITHLAWLPPTSDGGSLDPDGRASVLRVPRVFAPPVGDLPTAEVVFETNNLVGRRAQQLPLYQTGADVK